MSHGMDNERYAAVSAAAQAQLAAYGEEAARLAAAQVEVRSRDGRVRVRAAAGGEITGLRLSDDALQRYPIGVLGEVVTRTLREAQRRAEEAFQRGLAEMPVAAVAEAGQIMQELEAEGEE
jgi:DNA-binding protein YbaB